MSHFIGLCFGEYWESDLDHYCEGLEVEPYIKYTKQEAIEKAKRSQEANYNDAIKCVNLDSVRPESLKYYNSVIAKGMCISDEDAWEIVKSWGYTIDEEDNLLTTYNPDSKWDWYEVGGRWSGFLVLKEKDEEGDIIETNQALFSEIDWDYMLNHRYPPFCFVDAGGCWNEKGKMGWWGIAFDEKPDTTWEDTFKEYLKTVEDDCLVTVVDFHI